MKRIDAESKQLEKAERLLDSGKKDEALAMIKDILIENQENVSAWKLLARISTNPKEREYALYQLRKLGGSFDPEAAQSVDSGNVDSKVKQAYDQVKLGNRKIALNMIKPVLQKYPHNPGAWFVKGMAAKEKGEYLNALQTLEKLTRTDPEAKPYYDRLSKFKFDEKKRKRIAPMWFVGGGFVLLLLLVGVGLALPFIFGGSSDEGDQAVLEDVAASTSLTCEELIANALQISDQSCQRIGSNEVCYGNYQLISNIVGDPEEFNLVGDVLSINKLQALRASPLNLEENLWGVAVFKLQANMEGTVPGQNVTFLVFGNTDIQNASGDMSAFYFSTGFGGIQCKGVDFDGLQIVTPDGAGIVFSANGVDLVLEGDAIMTADVGGEMNVTMVTGSGTVSANGVSQTVSPGMYVSVPIDENLEASGAPSAPQPVSGQQASMLCQLYGINCPPGTTSIILIGPTPTTILTDTPTSTSTVTFTPTITPPGFIASSTPPRTSTPTNTKTSGGTQPTATKTLTPTPTKTSVPPTSPPAAASCSAISLTGGANGTFTVTNNNASEVLITQIYLAWPESNGNWRKVSFNEAALAVLNEPPPNFTAVIDTPSDKRTILPGQSGLIENMFVESIPSATGYTITVTFDIGCSKTRSN